MNIVLVKRTDAKIEPETPDSAALRRFLFEMVGGATEKDQKAWQRWIRALNEATAGSYFQIKIVRQRSTPFHKLTLAVITAVHKSQEQYPDFEVFRQIVKLGANFVTYVPDPISGELMAIPRSQSYEECSEEEVRQFFTDMCEFFRTPTCCAMLWPQAPIEQSMQGMLKILRQFDPE